MIGDRGYASIVFDFDSTLSGIEGIDELAGDARDAVAELTDRAMAGEVPLESVYGKRLELIRPSREAVEHLGIRYVQSLVPDAAETIGALRHLGKRLRIVSGGLKRPVVSAARAIGFHPDEVAAVEIRFDEKGRYAGFDATSPLTRDDGKARVIAGWRLPRPILLIGDGATDLAARPAVDAFAAFTAFERRPNVIAEADYVLDGPGIAGVLRLAASPAERDLLRATPWASLLDIEPERITVRRDSVAP